MLIYTARRTLKYNFLCFAACNKIEDTLNQHYQLTLSRHSQKYLPHFSQLFPAGHISKESSKSRYKILTLSPGPKLKSILTRF